ncbi:hypothetical protein EF294_19660 [Gordonia oryzae]|uniref:Uncharacterized protein n=1 Tax=Gordonia oryzae TaxID=2487349 RepID=A0A3N4G4P4_9ACTN|nr:hypothetical protein EF294_19660 [Gordonia oryzae]
MVHDSGLLPKPFAEPAKVCPAIESMKHRIVGATWTGIRSTSYLVTSTALTAHGPGTGLPNHIDNRRPARAQTHRTRSPARAISVSIRWNRSRIGHGGPAPLAHSHGA